MRLYLDPMRPGGFVMIDAPYLPPSFEIIQEKPYGKKVEEKAVSNQDR